MNLVFDECIALVLYLEFYGRQYDPLDERQRSIVHPRGFGNILLRRAEMKSLYLLLQEANISIGLEPIKYHFTWCNGELVSEKFDKELDALDRKKATIEMFYAMYQKRRISCDDEKTNHYESLKANISSWISKENDIYMISRLCSSLKDVLQNDVDIEVAALITYLNTHQFDNASQSLAVMNETVKSHGYYPDFHLLKNICKILRELGLIEKRSKRKLEQGISKKLVLIEQK